LALTQNGCGWRSGHGTGKPIERGWGGISPHRCHNRAFLLKFARARDAYRANVREHVQQFHVAVAAVLDGKPGGGESGIRGEIQTTDLVPAQDQNVPTADDTWGLQEAVIPYGQNAGVKKVSKATS